MSVHTTNNLELICNAIERKILSDEQLKSRVSKIKITWKGVEVNDEGFCEAVPDLEIEFK